MTPKPRPDLGVFAGIQSRLAEAAKLLDHLGPDVAIETDVADIKVQMRALVSSVAYATPTKVCPYCFGSGEGCRFCGGIGWVSEERMKFAPADLVKMADMMTEID